MVRNCVLVFVSLLIAGSALLAGCGGEGESTVASVAPGTVSFLAWDPPQTYEDSTVLDPYTELDYYEFYVRGDGNFTDNDLPVAQVAACVDILSPDGTVYIPALTTEFELQNLLPFLPLESSGFLSIRAVGMDGLKSQFSEPIILNQLS
ncbi:MAG: hypothetical protein HKM29_01290 [Deltaproteobacteria bacterium]|nr:hypothetical protein [Deltaproteobacteria bacterium]NNG46067.1 hypothetical protein [Deltaproteobacteria bacterium]